MDTRAGGQSETFGKPLFLNSFATVQPSTLSPFSHYTGYFEDILSFHSTQFKFLTLVLQLQEPFTHSAKIF